MGGFSKLGIILTVVLVLILTALILEVLYIIYRRRRLYLRTLPSSATTTTASASPDLSITSPSKELLYFLCWEKGRTNRIEPSTSPPNHSNNTHDHASAPYYQDHRSNSPVVETQIEVTELMKLQSGMGLYGPSRVLFTIKEEEREEILQFTSSERKIFRPVGDDDFDQDNGLSDRNEEIDFPSPSGVVSNEFSDSGRMINGGGFQTCLGTPTIISPCESPLYYTPAQSPGRDQI